MSLVSRIAAAIDDDDTDDSARIISDYKALIPTAQQLVDDFFISLCGLSLATMIKEEEAEEEEDEE